MLIPDRIRHRREARGLAAYELAEKAGISPSYLSLIETGAKLPSEEILVRIAEALGDDPGLYRAWLHLSRLPDPERHLEQLQRYWSVRRDPGRRERLRRGESFPELVVADEAPALGISEAGDDPDLDDRLRLEVRRPNLAESVPGYRTLRTLGMEKTLQDLLHGVAEFAEPGREGASYRPLLDVPLLEAGSDPGEDPATAPGIVETLHLDGRLLPPGSQRVFAYRPDAEDVRRTGGSIREGDLVVLTATPDAVDRAGLYAVRHEGRVVLSRVVRHGSLLLLLAPDDAGSPEPVECADERALRARIAGAVIATVRTWGAARRPAETAPRAAPPGRTARLEGDFLVRDCHWKDGYGWRPVQTATDLDYLEAHPGTKMRFRLLRGGRVRYLLEMSAEEWRRALGRHAGRRAWRENGYVVAVTRRRGGKYTEQFQDRWRTLVREPEEG